MNYLITVPLWGCLMNYPVTVSWWGCLMNYLTQVLWAPWNCVQTPIQVTAAPPLPPLIPSTIPHAHWAPLLATNHSHRYNKHHCHIKRQVSLPPLRPSFMCRYSGCVCHWLLSLPSLVSFLLGWKLFSGEFALIQSWIALHCDREEFALIQSWIALQCDREEFALIQSWIALHSDRDARLALAAHCHAVFGGKR